MTKRVCWLDTVESIQRFFSWCWCIHHTHLRSNLASPFELQGSPWPVFFVLYEMLVWSTIIIFKNLSLQYWCDFMWWFVVGHLGSELRNGWNHTCCILAPQTFGSSSPRAATGKCTRLESLRVGPWAMRVCKCFQHDQGVTRLHSTPSCDGQLCSFFIAPHGQPRRTNGVQFNYAVFLAQYGQLGWAQAWIRAQRPRIKWCAETVDIFGRRRSSSNLILCGLSLGSLKQSEWSVPNEFIQHTHKILWTWCWSRKSIVTH